MAKFISQRHTEHNEEYRLSFDIHGPGHGYGFPCDKHGQVFVERLTDVALENYHMCLNSGVQPHVVDQSYSYRVPAVIECDLCGAEVHLTDGLFNPCECGADYNMSGQRLASREQWGEETGESWADLVGPIGRDEW